MMWQSKVKRCLRRRWDFAVTNISKAVRVAKDIEGAGIARVCLQRRLLISIWIVQEHARLIGGARVFNSVKHEVSSTEVGALSGRGNSEGFRNVARHYRPPPVPGTAALRDAYS